MSVGVAVASMLGVAIFAEYELVARVVSWPLVLPRSLVLWAVAGSLTVMAAWLTARTRLESLKLARHLALSIALSAVAVVPVSAQPNDLSLYREFRLGMTLAAVAQQVGPTQNVRVTHQRPALIQELRWHPTSLPGSPLGDEAVREVVFSFYDGSLFRMLIEYDRQRTEGLTVDDLVDALALQYGPASRPRTPLMASLSNGSYLSDEVLATWEDQRVALTLFRPSYLSSFGLVVSERRLDGLARRASAEASRLDAQEAPQRERERQTAQREEARVKQEHARQTNKGTFRP